MVNQKLLAARQKKRWSQAVASEKVGVSELTYSRWEKAAQKPYLSTLDLLCKAFEMSPQDLGYSNDGQLMAEAKENVPVINNLASVTPEMLVGSQNTSLIVLTREQATLLSSILIGDDPMTNFDAGRRQALLRLLGTTGLTLAMPINELINPEPWDRIARGLTKPTHVNEETLNHFARLTEICWGLSRESQPETVQEILPTYLPKIETVAQTASAHQQIAAGIASQGYMLAAEVDKKNVPALERYCELAVQYSHLAGDYSIQVAALKQQATIALIAKKTDKALQTYQRALPLVRYVSPLLRSRIYMGLASAYARCGNQQDAQRYIGLAHEAFPSQPESDPGFSYTVCTPAVLHLYDGLAYMDLDRPQQAWEALENVEGLNPKLPVAESWRIEIINLQASSAAALGDLERSCTYVEAGAKVAEAQGYDIWKSESADVFRQIQLRWPHESQVKSLAPLFQP